MLPFKKWGKFLCALYFAGTCGIVSAGSVDFDDPLVDENSSSFYRDLAIYNEIYATMPPIPSLNSAEEIYTFQEKIDKSFQEANTRAKEIFRKSFEDGLVDAEGRRCPPILRKTLKYMKQGKYLEAFALSDAVLLNVPLLQELDPYWTERLLILTRDSFKKIEKREDFVGFSAEVLKLQYKIIPDLQPDGIWDAAVMEDIAQRCMNIGYYREAYELRTICLNKLQGTPASVLYLGSLNRLAETCIRMEKYEEAERLAQRVLEFDGETDRNTEVNKDWARNLQTKAALGIGNTDKAKDLSEEAMRSDSWRSNFKDRTLDFEKHIVAMDSALNLARLYLHKHHPEKASNVCQWIQQGEAAWDHQTQTKNIEEVFQGSLLTIPQILSQMEAKESAKIDRQEIEADICRDEGKHARALELYRNVTNSRRTVGSWRVNLLCSYWNQSEKNMHRLETLRALLSLVRECRIAELYTDADILAREGYARAKERAGIPSTLVDAFQEEIRRIQQSEAAVSAPPAVSLNELEKQWTFFKDYPMDVRRSAYAHRLPAYKKLVERMIAEKRDEDAFQTAELCKSRFLLEIFSRQIAGNLLDEDDRRLLDQRQSNMFRKEFEFKKDDFRDLMNGSAADVYFAWSRDGWDQAVNAYRFSCRQMEEKYPDWERASHYQPLSIQESLDFLPEETAYIGFLQLAPQRVLVMVLDKEKGFHAATLELPWDLSEECSTYHDLISYPNLLKIKGKDKFLWRYPDQSYRVKSYLEKGDNTVLVEDLEEFKQCLKQCRRNMASELGKALLEPLRPYISDNTSTWIISPDNGLAVVPFESLNYQGEPLISSVDVCYGASLSALKLLKDRHDMRPRQQEKSLFIVGDPAYDNESLSEKDVQRLAEIESLALGQKQKRYLWLYTKTWKDLDFAKDEIDNAKNCFADFNDTQDLLTQEDATRKNFMKRNDNGDLSQYKYILFATHGVFVPALPECSSLILRKDDVLSDEGLGLLTVLDLMSLHLNSDLVYLSACETGLGAYTTGEGIFGLPLAFNVAGNQDTVMSLWEIDDEAASDFSGAFFKRLSQGIPPVKALSDVKREWLKKENGKFADPFFWTPMILYGVN